MTEYHLGYDENILGKVIVPFPILTDKAVAVALKDKNGAVLYSHHLHYSLVMNEQRKLAMVSACGIMGDCWWDIPRSQESLWRPDPNIDSAQQVLGDFYKGNDWDKGHLTRRADVCYGKTREEAVQASSETFFYSNAAPQHAYFNQDEWVALETWILDGKAKKHKMPVAVFTGPIFGDFEIPDARTGFKIPQSYWKVVAFIDPKTQAPVSTAFLMNQTEMWKDKDGQKFLQLCLYQVMLKRIEQLTGLDFGEVESWDVLRQRSGILSMMLHLVRPRSSGRVVRITEASDIVL